MTKKLKLKLKLYEFDSLSVKCFALVLSFRTFYKKYHELKKTQGFTCDQLKEYQNEKLRMLISHSYENVPYYKHLFDTNNVKPADIRTIDDLSKIPFLTKEIIRENSAGLRAADYSDSVSEPVTTGGSTGTPLQIYYQSGVSRAIEWAFIKTLWDRIGYHFLDKCAVLRGYAVNTSDTSLFWKKSVFGRWLLLSPYHLKEENYAKYIEKIRAFSPKYILSYPSEISLLAKYMIDNEIPHVSSVKAVICSSETLFDYQREAISQAFNCRVFDFYGHTEQAVLAGGCETNDEYHIFPEYGIVELVSESGEIIESPDCVGEIVATNLNNYVFPLIRYKTRDFGVYAEGQCECGRCYKRFKHIEGRLQDQIFTLDGRKIMLTSWIFAQHFEAFSHIRGMQLEQNEIGHVIVRIIKSDGFSPEDEREILQKMQSSAGEDLKISFEYVDELQRTQNGKVRFLLQNLTPGNKNQW